MTPSVRLRPTKRLSGLKTEPIMAKNSTVRRNFERGSLNHPPGLTSENIGDTKKAAIGTAMTTRAVVMAGL